MEGNPKAEAAIAHCGTLDAERAEWEGLWDELAAIVHPRRNIITRGGKRNAAPQSADMAESFDGTAMRANRTLANGQASRITPMGARWMALKPPADLQNNPAAVRWYGECGEILARYLNASNFYNRAHEHYLNRGGFGTAATEVVGASNGRGLHFRSFDIGTYSIAQSEQDEVNTIFRTYSRSAAQLAEAFPDTIPEEVRKNLTDPKGREKRYELVHAIRPRLDRDPRKTTGEHMPFESLHILKGERIILAESGYNEFPVAVSRWEMWGEAAFGWPPAYLALPEASQANFLEQMTDTLAELAAFPRILYPANIQGDIDFAGMGLTCYDPTNGHKPEEWLTAGRYDIAKDRLRDKRQAINEAFFVPLFNAISQLDKDATATEVRAIVTESRELFHPIFANLVREFLRPVLRRSFAILLRQGAFPLPPRAVLRDGELSAFIDDPELEFTSSMALALEQSQLANFADCVNTLAPIAQADPSALDFIDLDQVGPAFFRYKGLPESFIKKPEVIAQIRQARAQAAQAEQMANASQAIRNVGGAQGIQDLAGLAQ